MARFIIEQKELLAMLASMQSICTKRTTLDATSSILFQVGHKELILKSTDLELSLQASCGLPESDVVDTQSFLVSGRRIFDIAKELSGDITFIIKDNQLTLKAGAVDLALNIKDAQEFPPFPERIENLMNMQAADLLEMLNKVSFLIPQNNTNPALNGLFVEVSDKECKMTTTDGHCLAQVTSPNYTLETARSWLVPRKAILEIRKILENSGDEQVFIGECGKQLVFSGSAFNLFTKLLVNAFPSYTAILNKEGFVPARLDRSSFIKTLRRSSCLLSGQFIATKFVFGKNEVKVSMQNKEVGKLEETLPLEEFSGGKLEIRFYAPYLLNGLQAFSDATSTIYLNNPSRPIILESADEEGKCQVRYLVMPVSPTAVV